MACELTNKLVEIELKAQSKLDKYFKSYEVAVRASLLAEKNGGPAANAAVSAAKFDRAITQLRILRIVREQNVKDAAEEELRLFNILAFKTNKNCQEVNARLMVGRTFDVKPGTSSLRPLAPRPPAAVPVAELPVQQIAPVQQVVPVLVRTHLTMKDILIGLALGTVGGGVTLGYIDLILVLGGKQLQDSVRLRPL